MSNLVGTKSAGRTTPRAPVPQGHVFDATSRATLPNPLLNGEQAPLIGDALEAVRAALAEL